MINRDLKADLYLEQINLIYEQNENTFLKNTDDFRVINILFLFLKFGGKKEKEIPFLKEAYNNKFIEIINNSTVFKLKDIHLNTYNLGFDSFLRTTESIKRDLERLFLELLDTDYKINDYLSDKINIILLRIKGVLLTYIDKIVNFKISKKDSAIIKSCKKVLAFESFKEFKKSNCFKSVKAEIFNIFDGQELESILASYNVVKKEFKTEKLFNSLKEELKKLENEVDNHYIFFTILHVKGAIVTLLLGNS